MTNSSTTHRTATRQFKRARRRVRLALRHAEEAIGDIAALSYMEADTLDNIARTLTAALRDLEGIARKEAQV